MTQLSSWWKVNNIEAYVNPAQCRTIYVVAGGGQYHIEVDTNVGSGQVAEVLEGDWPTQAEAEAAMKRLVQGIDPADY